MQKYIINLEVRQFDDRKMLKILSPLFIWLISIIVLLVIIGNAPDNIDHIAVILMFLTFIMIVPLFIVLYKKSLAYRKSQFTTLNAEFEVVGDKVFLNGREVVISFYQDENEIEVWAVSIMFDKYSGYALMDEEIAVFVKFTEENNIPIKQGVLNLLRTY